MFSTMAGRLVCTTLVALCALAPLVLTAPDTPVPSPSFITPDKLSPAVRRIYDRVLKTVPKRDSPTPLSKILTYGTVTRHYKHYGDTEHFARKSFAPELLKAKEEVLITTFILDSQPGPTTKALCDALVELNRLRKEGEAKLRVYIAFDPVGTTAFTGVSMPKLTSLSLFNGPIHPPLYGLPDPKDLQHVDLQVIKYHSRMYGSLHSKMMLIDGKVAIMGSKNLDRDKGFETMFAVEGGLARALRYDFAQVWQKPLPALNTPAIAYDATKHVPMVVVSRPEHRINGDLSDLDDIYGARLLDDDVPQNQAWLGAVEEAKSHILIITPNFSTKSIVDAVLDAIEKNPPAFLVTIITSYGLGDRLQRAYSSGYGSNSRTMEYMYKRLKAKGMAHKLHWCWFKGVRVSPHAAPNPAEWSHVKFMAVDDQFVIAGSGNQDPQSWYYSRENNVLIDDPATTVQMTERLLRQQQSVQECYDGDKDEVRIK